MLLYFILGIAFVIIFKILEDLFTSFAELIISAINVAIAKNNLKIKKIMETSKKEEEENPQEEHKIGF